MDKNVKKPILTIPYVVFNQLINSIWKACHLKNSLTYMLKGGDNNPTKN
jgi:hypothetical protein